MFRSNPEWGDWIPLELLAESSSFTFLNKREKWHLETIDVLLTRTLIFVHTTHGLDLWIVFLLFTRLIKVGKEFLESLLCICCAFWLVKACCALWLVYSTLMRKFIGWGKYLVTRQANISGIDKEKGRLSLAARIRLLRGFIYEAAAKKVLVSFNFFL